MCVQMVDVKFTPTAQREYAVVYGLQCYYALLHPGETYYISAGDVVC